MLRLSLFLLSLAILIVTDNVNGSAQFSVKRLISQRIVAPNIAIPPAPFVTHLSRKVPRRAAKKQALRELRQHASKVAVVVGADDDEEYATAVTVGNQQFEVIIDTGRCDHYPNVYDYYSHLLV